MAFTFLMVAADDMPEGSHIESISSASSSKLEVPISAARAPSLSEKKIASKTTETQEELRKEITALKTVQTQNEKLMADKDAEIKTKNAEIAAFVATVASLREQIKRQCGGPLLTPLSPLSPSRKMLVDKEPIESTPPSPKTQIGSSSNSCSQVAKRSSSDGPLPWAECPIGVLGEAMESDKCTESNYGFIHADSDKFTKGAWSRSILDNPRLYIYTHTEKPCVPLNS